MPSKPEPGLPVSDRAEQQRLTAIQRSGLFEGAWFAARNPDLAGSSHETLVHWHRYGWQEDRWPNPYFDPGYYRRRNPGCDGDPLLHYIRSGEAAGRRPVPYFDPAWYRRQYRVAPGELCLAHYLRHRCSGQVSPIPEFDAAFYLRVNPDVAAAGMDPMEHYLVGGFNEGRLPSASFDPRRGGGGTLHPNPLLAMLRWREEAGLDRDCPAHGQRSAAVHCAACRVRGSGGAAAWPGAESQTARLLPAALPSGAGERCLVGARLYRVDQSRPRFAALCGPLSAAHSARSRPLSPGRR